MAKDYQSEKSPISGSQKSTKTIPDALCMKRKIHFIKSLHYATNAPIVAPLSKPEPQSECKLPPATNHHRLIPRVSGGGESVGNVSQGR